MLVTMSDIASKCPMAKWIERTFTINVEIGQEMLVIRSRLQDMAKFKCTEDMLRATPLLQDKPEKALRLVAQIVNQKILHLAKQQAKLAELCALIVKDLNDKSVSPHNMRIIGEMMYDMLAEHEPHATLAGWPSWFKLCEAFVVQQ